jgi:hypothetical protein
VELLAGCDEGSIATVKARGAVRGLDKHIQEQDMRLDKLEGQALSSETAIQSLTTEVQYLKSTRLESELANRLVDRFTQFRRNMFYGWFPGVNKKTNEHKVMALLSKDMDKIKQSLEIDEFDWSDDECWDEILKMTTFQRVRQLYVAEGLSDAQWRVILYCKLSRNSNAHPEERPLSEERSAKLFSFWEETFKQPLSKYWMLYKRMVVNDGQKKHNEDFFVSRLLLSCNVIAFMILM